MNGHRYWLTLLAALAFDCHSKAEPPRPEPKPSPQKSAAPAPSLAPLPAPSSQEGSALPIEVPGRSAPLELALATRPPEYQSNYGAGVFDLYTLRGGRLVTLGEELYQLKDGKLLKVDVDELGYQPASYSPRAQPLYAEIASVQGRFPEDLWLEVSGMWVSDGARIHSPYSDMYRWHDGSLDRVAPGQPGTGGAIIVGWSGGRTLGYADGAFRLLGGPKSTTLPWRKPGKSGSPRVDVEAFAALPSGDVYALGHDAEAAKLSFAIEHWTDASSDSAGIHGLPSWFCRPTSGASPKPRLVASGPDDVIAICGQLGGGLVHFDGKDMAPIAAPAASVVRGAVLADDGSLWLLTDSTIYVRDTHGAWKSFTAPRVTSLKATVLEDDLPQVVGELSLQLTSLVALNETRAFVAGSLSDRNSRPFSTFLLSTDGAKLELPEPPNPRAMPAPSASATPTPTPAPLGSASVEGTSLGVDCKTPFVVLFSISDSAPTDYGYPATRDALASAAKKPAASFVEFRFKGHRTLGAKVASAAEGKALVELISARVKGSKPTPLCLDPGPASIREVKLD